MTRRMDRDSIDEFMGHSLIVSGELPRYARDRRCGRPRTSEWRDIFIALPRVVPGKGATRPASQPEPAWRAPLSAECAYSWQTPDADAHNLARVFLLAGFTHGWRSRESATRPDCPLLAKTAQSRLVAMPLAGVDGAPTSASPFAITERATSISAEVMTTRNPVSVDVTVTLVPY